MITSSNRDVPEKAMLTAASVTVIPASRMLRSDELQTETEEYLGKMAALMQLVVRGTTARYGPKFEPVTLMLLRRCDVAMDGDGVL
jgi:hypothetical protein